MGKKQPSKESKIPPLAEIDLPTGDGPVKHPSKFLDPRIVEKHFAPLMKNCPSPEERWARKANARPFEGV